MVKNLVLSGDNLEISGATKVVSSSPTQAVVETTDGGVLVGGTDIEVKKLNLDEGQVAFSGKINMLKFGLPIGKKPSLLKRIFK